MPDCSSGLPLPSRDAQEADPGPSWPPLSTDPLSQPTSKVALALAVLIEKIKSGALQRTELMQRLVAQTSAATGARGVALALRADPGGAVVCCAVSGDMAPPPGTVLDESSGFTAECLKNGTVMICEDSEQDERVDRAACRRLGVRSIAVAPVEEGGASVGVLEAFSDQAQAFSREHMEFLLTMACLAKCAISPTSCSLPPISVEEPAAVPIAAIPPPASLDLDSFRERDLREENEESRNWSERVPRHVRIALACGIAGALLLAVAATALLVWMWRHNADAQLGKAQPAAPMQMVSPKPTPGIASVLPPHIPGQGHVKGPISLVSKASAVEKISSGGPVIAPPAETGLPPAPQNEVKPPAPFNPVGNQDSTQLSRVLSVPESLPIRSVPVSDGITPPRLEQSVEPRYPAEARRQRIEGPVVLRANITEEGAVTSIRVVRGSPLLAQAAISAVQQWRYRPSELNHHAIASTTDITIVFHLQ